MMVWVGVGVWVTFGIFILGLADCTQTDKRFYWQNTAMILFVFCGHSFNVRVVVTKSLCGLAVCFVVFLTQCCV
jgi:hypothetical protein